MTKKVKKIYCIHCLLLGRETSWNSKRTTLFNASEEGTIPENCPKCKIRTWREDAKGVRRYVEKMREEADKIEETLNYLENQK